MLTLKIAILASGSGSNAENIHSYFSDRNDILISLILSNNPDAYVHVRAKKLGITSLTMSKEDLQKEGPLLAIMREYRIDFIVLAGYLLKIPSDIIQAFPNRIMNIHPALLPKFGGKGMYGNRVHEAVIANGEKESGITIHIVNECYDEGQIIFQATCPVLENDTPDSLASRVHALEYAHFPRVIDEWLKKNDYSKK